MRTAIGAAVAAALLAAAPVAEAKGVQSVELCGVSGCTTTHRGSIGAAFAESSAGGSPSRPAPFLRARVSFHEEMPPGPGSGPAESPRVVSVRYVLIPGQNLIRSPEDSDWRRIEDHGGLPKFLARVRPYPARRFPAWARRTLRANPASRAAATSVAHAGFPWLPLVGAAAGLAVADALGLRRGGGGKVSD
jgi:hypothetical protein